MLQVGQKVLVHATVTKVDNDGNSVTVQVLNHKIKGTLASPVADTADDPHQDTTPILDFVGDGSGDGG